MNTQTKKTNESSAKTARAIEAIKDSAKSNYSKLYSLAEAFRHGAKFSRDDQQLIAAFLVEVRNLFAHYENNYETAWRSTAYLLVKYDMAEALRSTTNFLYGRHIVEILRDERLHD